MNIKSDRITTVGALAFDGDKVLLVKHGEAAHHLIGVYGLPGGRLTLGEDLLEAVTREFQEETGLVPEKSTMEKIPTIYKAEIMRKGGEILRTSWNVFVVTDYSGELKGSDETSPEWVRIDGMSQLNLLPNTIEVVNEGLKIRDKRQA